MLQGGEIIIIALLALVVFGPKRLPDLARKLGRHTAELRRAGKELARGLEDEVEDLKKIGDDLRAPADEVFKPLQEAGDKLASIDSGYEWTGPKPVSGPTPEDATEDLAAINRISAEDEEE